MPKNLTQKLIEAHLVEGQTTPGEDIALRIDQTLTQDATGTLVMLELQAIGLDRVRTICSVQYVDHNLLQEDSKNPDDHLFLLSASQRFGLWYSRPGNGVSHPLHQEHFGVPGQTLLGSDSHTPAAGAIAMLAIGAGGLEVAMAMAGMPFYVTMPRVWGVELTGALPDWVSAKDVILEMLRRHGVKGGVNHVIEYYGPGLASLSAMDRHVIANMGAELGATTSIFPADEAVRHFLDSRGRGDDYIELAADSGAQYDRREQIDLSRLEPMIAMPSSPGNVKPVSAVEGAPIYQAYIGSSANPGYRDFAVVANVMRGRRTHPRVSFDVNPTSRELLSALARDGHLLSLLQAGARIHQAGCNGCIGMGQAPATHEISLRTVPRNFPGRSGTVEDKVCLVSPETAAASALRGVITDPRRLADDGVAYPRTQALPEPVRMTGQFVPPLPPEEAEQVALRQGPNVAELPEFTPLCDELKLEVLLKVGDDVSTDEIMPAGARVLPFRSNIPEISRFVFADLAPEYAARTRASGESTPHAIVGGSNYGQGSSREHAALAPRYLGLHMVIAKSFSRIHWQNLVNFGVLPLTFEDESDYARLEPGRTLHVSELRRQLREGSRIQIRLLDGDQESVTATHRLSQRQCDILIAGGLINWLANRLDAST
jgi:aconitate hydratase